MTRLRCVFIFVLWTLAIVSHAADTTVRATLSRGISVIGDPVQLQIKINGAHQPGDPPDVKVDGLEINYLGPSQNTVMRFENGSFTSERTTILVYQVTPKRNGTFSIPSVTVQADGKSYRTEPISLTVQPSSATDQNSDFEKPGLAEFWVPKKTLYLGEAMPAELRLYVDSRIRWQPIAMPDIDGEGFTKQNMPKPRSQQVEKNGRDCDLLTFKTVISPIRAGKITLGPSEIPFQARVPHAQRNSGRSPFGNMFGDVFDDPFFSANQQFSAKAEPVELTVKPLPSAGKPADFSGAVGEFHLAAEGNPKQVKVGDPITIKLRVSGKGNFDRVTAPVLTDPAGWRTYPPSSSFKAENDLNSEGEKTFEIAVVPETKKSAMPVFQFAYFNPVTEKYVVVKTDASPLVVEGEAPATPPPAATAPEDASPQKQPPIEHRPNDILGLRYDHDRALGFAPLYEQREFWFVQGSLAVILIGFVGFKMRRRPDAVAQQKAALRQERDAVWRRLRRTDMGHVDFFDAAARVVQIDTALATGRSVASVDTATVRSEARLDEQTAATIEDIFNARAELYYAGGGSDDGRVSAIERDRVLAALKQLEKNYARN